jgi:hypothetical protein
MQHLLNYSQRTLIRAALPRASNRPRSLKTELRRIVLIVCDLLGPGVPTLLTGWDRYLAA